MILILKPCQLFIIQERGHNDVRVFSKNWQDYRVKKQLWFCWKLEGSVFVLWWMLSLKSVFLLEVQEYDCRIRGDPATKFLLQTVQVFSFI